MRKIGKITIVSLFGLGLSVTAIAGSFPCMDTSSSAANFLKACNSYVKLEELSSGVVGRYKGDPCECLVREFKGLHKLSKKSDCTFERDDVMFMFRDDDAKVACIHKK